MARRNGRPPLPRRSDPEGCLTPEEMAAIHKVTDKLNLSRDFVLIPLAKLEEGVERTMPDGKLLIQVPARAPFEEWLSGLEARLRRLDLARVPDLAHPPWERLATNGGDPRSVSSRKYVPRGGYGQMR